MPYFTISESEAILIGRCLALYLEELKDDPNVRFTEHVSSEITPFTTNHAADGPIMMTLAEPPESTEWIGSGSDRTGFSESCPQLIFMGNNSTELWDDACLAFQRVEIPRMLDVLVVELVRDLLDPSLAAVRNTLPPSEWGAATFAAERERLSEAPDAVLSDSPIKENAREIEERLTALVCTENNQHRGAFAVGRDLGALEAMYLRGAAEELNCLKIACKLATSAVSTPSKNLETLLEVFREAGSQMSVGRWQRFGIEQWHSKSELIVESLLMQTDIRLGSRSRLILEQHQQTHEHIDEDAAGFFGNLVAAQRYLRRLHFVLGEVIGRSHTADEVHEERERKRPTPRFAESRLTRESSIEKIRATVALAEDNFLRFEGNSALPNSIVSLLQNGIQAMIKRNWPEKLFQDIPDLLRGILKSGAKAECRFASTALHMYKAFRNDNTHNFIECTVTPLEAVTFLNSFKCLIQYSDEIVASRDRES